MAVYHSFVRAPLKTSGFILTILLVQLLFFSLLCVEALESYGIQLRLSEQYISAYENSAELKNQIIHAKQPLQLMATEPCSSAQFYQVMVVSKPLKLTKIIAVPYQGECRGKVSVIKYGIQGVAQE